MLKDQKSKGIWWIFGMFKFHSGLIIDWETVVQTNEQAGNRVITKYSFHEIADVIIDISAAKPRHLHRCHHKSLVKKTTTNVNPKTRYTTGGLITEHRTEKILCIWDRNHSRLVWLWFSTSVIVQTDFWNISDVMSSKYFAEISALVWNSWLSTLKHIREEVKTEVFPYSA